MARLDLNRSGDMEVFVRVVELGGFSAAARTLGISPSAVSKLMARLEARLGVRLLNRSTRKIQLTAEGTIFFDRSVRVLGELDEAEREVAPGGAARGRLRVNANVPFGLHCLLPLVPAFLARHPEVTIEVALTDAVVDLLEDRVDVAIRTGPLRASRLVARKLGESRMIVIASPAYLERHGTPRTPGDLTKHNRLGFAFAPKGVGWHFLDGAGGTLTLPPAGNALVSDGESMRALALAGLGVARLAAFHVGPDIEAGRLVPLLERFSPGETDPVHAVFVGQGGKMASRVRAFLDYLVANVRLRE